MKKLIVSAIMSVGLLTGASAYAQTQSDGQSGATKQSECCQTTQGDKAAKGDKKGIKAGKGFKGEKRGQRPRFNPFEGVQLTDEQQQKLQVLQQGLGPVILDKEQQGKIKENPNLTPEQKKQLKEERKAKKLEAKKNYLNGVKEILAPDQYVVFLENCYLFAPQGQDKGSALKHGKESKGRKGKGGQEGDKGAKERK